jgi:hypothetical protein
MDGITGFAAVVMALAIPTSAFAMYTFYRVRKLRTEERMAEPGSCWLPEP